MKQYHLVVIGSGPDGEKGAAAQAAYFGKQVAVVERSRLLGGACINTGTIREDLTVQDFMHRKDLVIDRAARLLEI